MDKDLARKLVSRALTSVTANLSKESGTSAAHFVLDDSVYSLHIPTGIKITPQEITSYIMIGEAQEPCHRCHGLGIEPST